MTTKQRRGISVPPLTGFQPRAGRFDQHKGLYVPVGCRGLSKFNSDLAKVRTGSTTARATIALAGHSLMAGYTTSVGTYDPGSVLRKMLSQSLGVKSGSGLVPTFNGDAVGFTDDSRYSKSGTFIWLGSAGNLVPWAYGSTAACSVTFTSNNPGTVMDILVSDGFGNLTYSIDGEATQTITVGGTSAYKLVTRTGLVDKNHTVTISSAAGTEIVVGVNVRYPSDLEVHDFGIVGTSAADWVGTTNYASSLGTIVNMAPSCVAIMLGHAEIQAGTSIATYKTNMQTMITAFTGAGSDVILIGAIPLSGYTDAQWLPYREALFDLADTNSCLLVDPYPTFGTYAGAVALGLYNGVDIAHLTNAGNAELMRLVAGAFMEGTGSSDLASPPTVAAGQYMAAPSRKNIAAVVPIPSSATPTVMGCGVTATGTATLANLANTNAYTRAARVEYLATVAATTAVAGWRTNNAFLCGTGGYCASFRFGPATGQPGSTGRMFVGMKADSGAPTDVQPSSFANIIGAGFDAADTNLQIFTNDASGTATKTDTGIPRSATNASKVYRLVIACAAGGASIVATLTDEIVGTAFTTTVTTDLPVATTLLSAYGYCSAGGVSSVEGLANMGFYAEW